jgi:hypothetical protein
MTHPLETTTLGAPDPGVGFGPNPGFSGCVSYDEKTPLRGLRSRGLRPEDHKNPKGDRCARNRAKYSIGRMQIISIKIRIRMSDIDFILKEKER